MRLASLGNCSCRALGFSPAGVSRVFTRVCLLAKHQPRWIGRLFPLALLLAGTVLMGAVPVHAGTTISDYGNGSCVDDDHWVKAKTDPNWTCQITGPGPGGLGEATLTFDYADHHILTANQTNPCGDANKLPSSNPKFCFKVGNEVRGVWSWSNTSKLK